MFLRKEINFSNAFLAAFFLFLFFLFLFFFVLVLKHLNYVYFPIIFQVFGFNRLALLWVLGKKLNLNRIRGGGEFYKQIHTEMSCKVCLS